MSKANYYWVTTYRPGSTAGIECHYEENHGEYTLERVELTMFLFWELYNVLPVKIHQHRGRTEMDGIVEKAITDMEGLR